MPSKKGIPLHAHLWMLFGSIILLVGVLICGANYLVTKTALESATTDATRRIGEEMLDEVEDLLAPAQIAVKLVRYSSLATAASLEQRMARLALAREALESAPVLQALYVGYADGSFFYVRPLRTNADRALFHAPANAAYLVRSIEGGRAVPSGRLDFFDAGLANIRTMDDAAFARRFDPRKRSWYEAAIRSNAVVRTEPYVFFMDQGVGITFAFRTPDQTAVVGGDFGLEALGAMLAKKKATATTMLALLDHNGKVLGIDSSLPDSFDAPDVFRSDLLAAPTEYGIPVLTALASSISPGVPTSGHTTLSVHGERWFATTSVIPATTGPPVYLLSAIPEHELLADARRQAWIGMAVTVGIVLLSMPLLWLVARRIAKPLGMMAEGLAGVRKFDFDQPLSVRTRIREVATLATATEQMRQSIQHFLIIVQAVAAEARLEQLVPVLLRKTLSEAGGKAGIFFLMDGDDLVVAAAQDRNGRAIAQDLPRMALDRALPLIRSTANHAGTQCAALTRDDLDAAALGAVAVGEVSHAAAIPLANQHDELQGLILVLRETPMDAAQLAFVSTLSSFFAGAIEVRKLASAQRELFDAFIRLLADAIDAKSPHTAGHCSRVPELVKMLAQAACDARDGPYQSFTMSDTEWEALHVAGWLHDCGKVTTPEYIIDKGTKLETLYNRIHEVRMRFEVLKRDAEIHCLRNAMAKEDAAIATAQLGDMLRDIDDDFAFVAECNQGGESLDAARKARLLQIAARTWSRTLDDGIGLSREERVHREKSAAVTLPVQEPLLADKPEHLVPRTARDTIAPDNPWGFQRKAPAWLYHRGELHNLMIERGTLCEEERFKIEDHIVQTQIMLSRLPFPNYLRQVPEIAGNHHEKMDGTGYPRRLRREDMSPLARMMAIADIFEALTAADRPYKRAKTLSESIEIMARAAAQQQIDPELFELFLTSRVYLQYGKQFMHEEQMDAVDITRYVRGTVPDAASDADSARGGDGKDLAHPRP